MWVDTNKELLISIKITEGLRSNGGGSTPSASLHQPRKVESGIHKSQLFRRPRLFFHTQASYFGASSGAPRHTERNGAWLEITDVPSGSHGLHLSGSCRVSSRCMWSPQRCPNESDLTPTPTSWWQNILKQRDSLGLHDALNHIFRIWTWVTLTTRHSKHSGISFRDITANADLQKQQPLTYDTVEEYRSCGK